MRAQLGWTLVTELAVMAAGIFVLKLAAQLLGATGFGEYMLSRRAAGLIYLPLVMGLGIAAPRYIAIARTHAMAGYSEGSFAIGTLLIGTIPTLAVMALMNLDRPAASALIFGNTAMQRLIPAAALVLGGLTLHTLVYAVFRGRGEMHFANFLQLLDNGIVPVAAFVLVPHNAAAILTATGSAWIAISGIAMLVVLVRESGGDKAERSVSDHLRILLRFGAPRVPGEFALVGLFALPALIALRTQGIVAAGQFSAGMSLLSLVSGVFAPVGLVILPRASAQAAGGDLPGLRRLVVKMLTGGILLIALGVLIGELLIPPFVRWYFGKDFIPAIPIFRMCLLGAIPYVVYILLRNILDALDVRALNSRNLIVTLILLVLLCLARSDIMSMAVSLLVALTLLSILSLRDTNSLLGRRALATPSTVPA
jgi:O-antigen/teichoic acid export membrane protein